MADFAVNNKHALVFFDPDNGLEVKSVRRGGRNSSKYLYYGEVEEAYKKGLSVLIFQYFPRARRDLYIARRKAELKKRTGAKTVFHVRTPRVVFFLLPAPGKTEYFRNKVHRVDQKWPGKIVCG